MKVLGINGSHRAGKGTAALLQAARFPRPASTTAEGRERSRACGSGFLAVRSKQIGIQYDELLTGFQSSYIVRAQSQQGPVDWRLLPFSALKSSYRVIVRVTWVVR